VKNLNKKWGDKIKFKIKKYIGANTRNIRCRCKVDGYKWNSSYWSLMSGYGCSKCTGCLKYTKEEVLKNLNKKWGDKIKFKIKKYIGTNTRNIECECMIDGYKWKSSYSYLIHGRGCRKCSNISIYTTKEFIKKAKEIHGNKYDYSEVECKNNKDKVTIICKKQQHGKFQQTASQHLHGNGCSKCAGNIKYTKEEMLKNLNKKCGDKIECEIEQEGAHVTIQCKCKIDGFEWGARYDSLMRGGGCPYCNLGWTISSIKNFIKSILPLIPKLNQIEWYHILNSCGVTNIAHHSKGYNFIQNIFNKERLNFDELENFANDKPNIYDDMIDTGENVFADDNNDFVENNNYEDETHIDNVTTNSLPELNERDIFSVLEYIPSLPSSDKETIEALIGEQIWKLIQIICENEHKITDIKKKVKGPYAKEAQNRIVKWYNQTKKLKLPQGYNLKDNDNKLIKPNLMQKLTVVLLKEKKKMFNLSGTGAGKTLSAVWASYIINSKLTIIICPNDVKEGWIRTIKGVLPSAKIFINNFSPQLEKNESNFIIFNIEKFQLPAARNQIAKLVKNKIDFVIIDEIQFAKYRSSSPQSSRNKNIHALLFNIRAKNSDLYFIGMTATPVINDLSEAVSLFEMADGVEYTDFETSPNMRNCARVRGKFVDMGLRWMPEYKQELNIQTIPIDCSDLLNEVKKRGRKSPLGLEQIFIEDKLDAAMSHIESGTVIYTQYREGIVQYIRSEIKEKKKELRIEEYTGDQNSHIREQIIKDFINKKIDVLIATSPISTGVDGLQYRCHNLVILSLPWTSSLFLQLIGRFLRQGQKKKKVNVWIPLSYINLTNPDKEIKEWSWCKYRYNIIKGKKTLSDVAVDGTVLERHHIVPQKALKAAMDWIDRIEGGDIYDYKRREIKVSLSPITMKKRTRTYGQFTELNRKWISSRSITTHKRLCEDVAEYETYHNLYEQYRKEWSVDHLKDIIIPRLEEWNINSNLIVGDFGSGPKTELANLLNCTVYSFDHVESDGVIECDISNMPKEYHNLLDVAVFSLSLMGSNLSDYIREARECLKLNGRLMIVDFSSRIQNIDDELEKIHNFGFKKVEYEVIDKFIVITAIKSQNKKDHNIKLSLGRSF
jgi:superfamily II DNA or RNA helicase